MDFKQLCEANKTIKTTDIKGKEYAEVNQRIKAFRILFPNGSIENEIVSLENGTVVFKATVKDEDGNTLGVGHAYEHENSSFINKTSYIENCVPLDSQILTTEGWKYFYQVGEGTKIWSYNLEKGCYEEAEIKDVNFYRNKTLLELSTSKFKVRCTPKHKWIVRSQYEDIHKVATEDIKVSQKIVTGVRQNIKPSKIGQKLGWLMCDCTIKYTDKGLPTTAYINQSKYVEEISDLFGSPSSMSKKHNDSWMDNYEWCLSAETVRCILGYFDMVDYNDLPRAIAKMSIEDVAGVYKSMMLADGSKGRFESTYLPLVKAIQIACARLGISTTFITERMQKKSTKPIYRIGIQKTDGAYFSEMRVASIPPQDVWCPTTTNGTWIMKQDNFVTLTSNCETSAVGRALGMVGIGVDTSVASYEEVANAINNQDNMKAKKAMETTPKNSMEALDPCDKEQIETIKQLCVEKHIDEAEYLKALKKKKFEDLTKAQASAVINKLKG